MAEGARAWRTPRTVAVERLTAGDHACLGFRSHEDRWALRAAFATAALARGERVMFFTAPGGAAGDRGDAALARLASYGVPARQAAAEGRLEVVGAAPGFDAARGFDAAGRADYWVTAADDALTRGFAGLRVAGDMTWACDDRVSKGELTSYERDLTPLFAELGVTALCEYDRRVFPPAPLRRVLAAHPLSVLPTPGALHAAREGDVLRLAGDADLATRAAFDWAVAESGLTAVDLTGLASIDAYCIRALLRLTGGVVLECTGPQLRLLRLCGLRQAEGVVAHVR